MQREIEFCQKIRSPASWNTNVYLKQFLNSDSEERHQANGRIPQGHPHAKVLAWNKKVF